VRNYERCNPLRQPIEKLDPEWEVVAGMQIPRSFRKPAGAGKSGALHIADVSVLPKMGLAGPRAAEWIKAQGIAVPARVYDWGHLPQGKGLVIRLPYDEFFLEDGLDANTVSALRDTLGEGLTGCHIIERQDTGLHISGSDVLKLMLQCCGVDFTKETDRAVMTRVAGVSCMALWTKPLEVLRLWCPSGAAVYLWNALSDIVHDLGGTPAGLDTVRSLL